MLDFERNFRSNGVIAVVLFLVALVIYGSQPKVGAWAEQLVSFDDGDRTRILIATVIFGFAVLTGLLSLRRDSERSVALGAALLRSADSCQPPDRLVAGREAGRREPRDPHQADTFTVRHEKGRYS